METTTPYLGDFSELNQRMAKYSADVKVACERIIQAAAPKIRHQFQFVFDRQPWFVLIPMIYMDYVQSSGINFDYDEYINYTAYLVILMALTAVIDDTMDHSEYRSSDLSYPGKYGFTAVNPMIVAMTGFLYDFIENNADQRIIKPVSEYLEGITRLYLGEVELRFAKSSQAARQSLNNHYEQAFVATALAYRVAEAQGAAPVSDTDIWNLGAVQQDVDDLVNVYESQGASNHGDDLLNGVSSLALLNIYDQNDHDIRALWSYGYENPNDLPETGFYLYKKLQQLLINEIEPVKSIINDRVNQIASTHVKVIAQGFAARIG